MQRHRTLISQKVLSQRGIHFVGSVTFVLLLLFVAVPVVQPCWAQTQSRVTGRITDSSGAVITNARIIIEDQQKGTKRVLESNGTGDYVAPNLDAGTYSVSAEAANFRKVVRPKVLIEVGTEVRIDFTLQPGSINDVVQVTDEAPLVDATTTTLQGVMSNKAINELPLQGRDFQNLLGLHPGVQREPGGGFHSTTSNGLRPDDNNYVIDGATDNDAYYGETVANEAGISGTPASNLPLDAIQEFNTQEDPQADFGQKPGVVVNIGIKSGTDQIHGTGYYFHRNAAIDARNWFDPAPQPVADLILHQFGASIGGPIIKGKWFYFANYEGVRSKVGNPYDAFTPVTSSLASTSWGFDPDASIVDALTDTGCGQTPLPSGCSQLSLNLLKYFPKNPGFTANPNDPTAINFNFDNRTRADNLVFKSDYHLNDHHTFSGRFIYANTNQIEEDVVPVQPYWLSRTAPITQVFGGDWTWTPGSRWVNTARISYNRFNELIAPLDSNVNPTTYGLNTGITDPRLFGFPRINPGSSEGFDYLGGNSSWPLGTTPSHTENYSDDVAYTVGKHALRFGGSFTNGGVDYYRATYGRGRIDFSELDNFLTGDVRRWRLLVGDPGRNLSQKSVGFFVQDDFRATKRITLNLGLRYDVTRPISDSRNQLANYVPSQGIVQVGQGISEPYKTNWTNFSPRLGVAFDVFGTGKTILRSGFGMIYVQPSIRSFAFSGGGLNLNPSALIQPGANGNINSFLIEGADPSIVFNNWNTTGPIFPLNDPTLTSCSSDSPCAMFAVDQRLKTPYVLNWNLNLQQSLGRSTALQVGYVANRGVQLYSTTDLNQVNTALDDGSEQLGRPLTASCPAPIGLGIGNSPCYPYISFLNFLGNQSTSSYQSLQATLTHRYAHGLYLLAGYTWAHAIDTAGNTSNLGFAPQNSLDYAAEKASGDFDIRHRFTLSLTYDLPSRKGFGQMLEGWQVTTIAQIQTGEPILLYDDSDDLPGTDEGPDNANNDRWNIIGNPNNLRWSRSTPIPSFDPSSPQCTAAANTPALQQALSFVGFCYSQNGVTLYPNAFDTFGNMGRNILRGPGFANWDASISKIWHLNERFQLQLRGEMFNILNHANFAGGSVSGDLSSPDILGLAAATPDVQAANPVVGSGGSRHIQIGAKVIW